MTGEVLAAFCSYGVVWILGVGFGRWRLARFEHRIRRAADRLYLQHLRERAGEAPRSRGH